MLWKVFAACGAILVVIGAFFFFAFPKAAPQGDGTPDVRSIVALGESTRGLLISVTPLEVVEDSRCPADVQCIQAGTVRVLVMVEGDELTRTVTLEKPLVVGDAILVLEAVDPSARAGVPISREAYHFHFKTDAANQSTGTLVGSIGIGPLCPVENAAEPCNVSPEVYAALKVYVYKADKKTLVVTLTPDEKGKYRTDLPVGTYWVTTDERPEIGSIEGAPEEVEIRPLQTAVISIVIDTGIR